MSALIGSLRRLATTGVGRRLTRVTPLLRLSFSLRAVLVRERGRFVLGELRPRGRTATYTLRDSHVSLALRHHTPDVMVLDELFSQREYEPPEAAASALATLPARLSAADLGANIGLFGVWLLDRFPEARIVAFEPDPGNAVVHRRAIAANGRKAEWRLVEACAASAPGTVPFEAGAFATSHAAEAGALQVEAVDVFPHLEAVDLLKIDIEGSEWAILGDPRFRELTAAVVVLEYHPDGCPAPDPRAAAQGALRAAGYSVTPGPQTPGYGTGVLWGVRRHRSPSTSS